MTTYEVSLEPIIYMGGALSGFGMAGRLLLPLTEDFAGNISVGTGAIPFQFDSHVQYSIYPDFDNQIAFSVGGGMSYLRKDTFNHVTLYAYPIISKTFRWGGFILTPYALAPIGVSFFHDTMDVPLRVSLGAKATNPELKHVFFYLEGGVGILNAPHLISFGIAFQFNSV